MTQLDERFPDDQPEIVRGLSLIPKIMKTDTEWKTKKLELAKIYHDGLPSPENLDTEILYWKAKWDSSTDELPTKPQQTLSLMDCDYFPNLYTLLRLICTILVTSCACERSISVLRRVKSYLWSTMGQERLKGLLLMHIHHGMEVDLEKVVSVFAMRNPRRMALANALKDSQTQ